jgi:hypothetical protein
MRETLIIYGLVIGIVFLLIMGLRWLAPYLDRWGERQDAAEEERRRPKYPRPNIVPPSQTTPPRQVVSCAFDYAYKGMTAEEAKIYNQAFNSAMLFTRIGQTMEHIRHIPDIEDEA